VADPVLVDEPLAEQMALVRRLVELGRAARADSGVKTRQPLPRALVAAPGWAGLPEDLRAQVGEELNVLEVGALADAGELVDHGAKANFRSLGRRFGQRTPAVAAAVAAADAGALAAALAGGGTATVTVDGEPIALTAEEVVVTETPRTGWSVAAAGGETVALDLEVTPALRRAGLAREVVRLVQEARKASGFEVSDRIEVWWQASGETAQAVEEHAALLADEVLASRLTAGRPAEPLEPRAEPGLGLTFWLRLAGPA
jgi:isoleucyl-tRNA synthetase